MKFIITEKQLKTIKEQISKPKLGYQTATRDVVSTYKDKQKFLSPEEIAKNKADYTKKKEEEIRNGKGKESFLGVFDIPVTYDDLERQNAPTVARKVASEESQFDVYKNIGEILLNLPLGGFSEIVKFLPSEISLLKKNGSAGQEVFVNVVKRSKPKFVAKYGETTYNKFLNELMGKQMTKEEFIKFIKDNDKRYGEQYGKFVGNYGIKFHPYEAEAINELGNKLYSKIRLGATEVSKERYFISKINTKTLHVEPIEVKILSTEQVEEIVRKTNNESLLKSTGWMNPGDGKIYINWDLLKKHPNFKMEIKTLFDHEFAHVKDPAISKSPKLNSTYNPNAGTAWEDKEWFDQYYHHTFETNAMRAQFLQHMSIMTKSLTNKIGKDKVLSSLDEIIKYFSVKNTKLSNISLEILSYRGKNQKYNMQLFLQYLHDNRVDEFKKLSTQIIKQCLYLKDQVKVL